MVIPTRCSLATWSGLPLCTRKYHHLLFQRWHSSVEIFEWGEWLCHLPHLTYHTENRSSLIPKRSVNIHISHVWYEFQTHGWHVCQAIRDSRDILHISCGDGVGRRDHPLIQEPPHSSYYDPRAQQLEFKAIEMATVPLPKVTWISSKRPSLLNNCIELYQYSLCISSYVTLWYPRLISPV